MESPDAVVAPSLHALLNRIVDYAGYFPPADLPLAEALRNYAEYRQEPEAWMLNHFVVPVRLLDDVSEQAGLFSDRRSFTFSVLGTGGADPDTFLRTLENDLTLVDAFHERHESRARIEAMEVRLPASLVGASAEAIRNFLNEVDRRIIMAGISSLDLFLEVPVDDRCDETLLPILAGVAEHNSRQPVPSRCPTGLKIRCGGAEPEDIPHVAHVATFIMSCRNAGVRFKATAGLHHPVRHYDDDVGTTVHGFFNVFGAAVMAVEHELRKSAVVAILTEENPENFRFLQKSFAWRDLTVPVDAVHHVRDNVAISFGSCSFVEPVEDLRELSLM